MRALLLNGYRGGPPWPDSPGRGMTGYVSVVDHFVIAKHVPSLPHAVTAFIHGGAGEDLLAV